MSKCNDYCNNNFKIYDDCVCEVTDCSCNIDCSSCIGQVVTSTSGLNWKIIQSSISAGVITTSLESGQNLVNANLDGASLINANLSGEDLSGANLINSNLVGTFLSGSNLSNASIINANLFAAELDNANLTGANLSGSNLRSVLLSGANLTNSIISDTIFGFSIGQSVSLQVGSTTPLNIPTGYTFTPAVPPAAPTLRRDF